MAETSQPATGDKKCMVCGINSEERILLCGEYQGRKVWVCAGCLPGLIHGAH